MWSIELSLEVLFELDHDGMWFYLNNLVPHSDNTTRLIPVPTVKCSAKKGDFVMSKHDDQAQLAKGKVQVGDSAPDFTLPDQSGVPVSLGHFLGKTDIVLYFYPRDNTAVCTAEACAFQDSYELFKQAGAEVIGISSDSVESHRQFAAAHRLPFILLSDMAGVIRKRYGVPTAFGLPGRVTYIIDRQGMVRHIFFSQFTAEKHVAQALSTLQSIREEDI